jgi:uncharacterized membrane protein
MLNLAFLLHFVDIGFADVVVLLAKSLLSVRSLLDVSHIEVVILELLDYRVGEAGYDLNI